MREGLRREALRPDLLRARLLLDIGRVCFFVFFYLNFFPFDYKNRMADPRSCKKMKRRRPSRTLVIAANRTVTTRERRSDGSESERTETNLVRALLHENGTEVGRKVLDRFLAADVERGQWGAGSLLQGPALPWPRFLVHHQEQWLNLLSQCKQLPHADLGSVWPVTHEAWEQKTNFLLTCVNMFRQHQYDFVPVRHAFTLIHKVCDVMCQMLKPKEAEERLMERQRSRITQSADGRIQVQSPVTVITRVQVPPRMPEIPMPTCPSELLRLLGARFPLMRLPTEEAFAWIDDFLQGNFQRGEDVLLGLCLVNGRSIEPWQADASHIPELTWHHIDAMSQTRERKPKNHVLLRMYAPCHTERMIAIPVVKCASVFIQRFGALDYERTVLPAILTEITKSCHAPFEDEPMHAVGKSVFVPVRQLDEEGWSRIKVRRPCYGDDFLRDSCWQT